MEDVKRPLEGIKVVEMATFIAVPAVGRILADLGAEVIKIESAKGDNLRYTAPNEGRPSDPREDINFDLENGGKKGIVVDLRTDKGREVLFKLLDDADVFLTNWRPQALARKNLTYDDLKGRYPSLVYASLTGARAHRRRARRTVPCQDDRHGREGLHEPPAHCRVGAVLPDSGRAVRQRVRRRFLSV